MAEWSIPHLGARCSAARYAAWPIRRLGSYSPLAGFFVLGMLVLSASRALLIAWQWPRVGPVDALAFIVVQGMRSDLLTLATLSAPALLLLPGFVVLAREPAWVRLASGWLATSLVLILLLELATPQFLIEYDSRPNRLFIEYLVYPLQVLAMLWNGYPTMLLGVLFALGVSVWISSAHFRGYRGSVSTWRMRTTLMVWPLVIVASFLMIRSSLQHRPANLASFAFCDDAMVNSLVVNSAFSVLSAIYGLNGEGRSSEVYGVMPVEEMIASVRHGMGVASVDFVSAELPTLHRQVASVRRTRPLNLVIVLEESLGAGFVGSLGGSGMTPHLDQLSNDGIWFEQLYATGTRSVRGIEAVVAGFPPTPALSVVKLPKAQRDFATLASVLRASGYRNEFVYGGESHFDNMRGFFLGNGFHSIVERSDYTAPKFVGSWGVSDEDLFDKAHERIVSHSQGSEPFFTLVFSSSNHSPFEFPDGRIELADTEKQTVNNAVKYADHALGHFIRQARTSRYWDNTVFLIVADHDTRVYGDALVPIDKFHIPGLIMGADIQPRRIVSTASQIDLAPTLLSLLGVDSTHPFTGRDLTRTLMEFGNTVTTLRPRAMMQFDQNFAWLQDGEANVLLPDGTMRSFQYDSRTRDLRPLTTIDPHRHRAVLAQVLAPAWLYREQRYRLQ